MPFLTPQQQKAEMAHLAQGRIPFYYSEKDIAAGKAAESVPESHLRALAEAHRTGLETRALRPDVSEYVLANALRENRVDFGVNPDSELDYVQRKVPAYMQVAGKYEEKRAELLKKLGPNAIETDSDIHPELAAFDDDVGYAAHKAIGILSAKQRPDRSAEEVIRRWNGGGPLSYRHQRHVKDMHKMLQHPANSRVLEMYNSFLRPQRSTSAE